MSKALSYLQKHWRPTKDGPEFFSCNIMKKVYGLDVRFDYQDKMRPPHSQERFVWLWWYEKRIGIEKTNELRLTLMALYEEAFINEH